jgi:hypothetical protein
LEHRATGDVGIGILGRLALMTACRELTRKAGRFGLLLAVVASVSGCASSGLFDGIWGEDSSTAAAATGDAIAPDLASAKQGEAVAARS